MSDFKEKDYRIFQMFDKQWAIVTHLEFSALKTDADARDL